MSTLVHGNPPWICCSLNSSFEYVRIVHNQQGQLSVKKEAILWNEWDIHGSPYEQCENFIVVTQDINATNHVGITALQSAIKFHAGYDIVALLLKNGADVRVKNKKGETAILYAKSFNASKRVLWQLRESAKSVGITPLHVAMMLRLEPEKIRDMLEKGAEIEAKDNEMATPLHYAFKFKASLEVVTILLGYGANIHAKDVHGKDPLQYADTESEVVRFQKEAMGKNSFDMKGLKAVMGNDPAFRFD